jgi:hypothetical protein
MRLASPHLCLKRAAKQHRSAGAVDILLLGAPAAKWQTRPARGRPTPRGQHVL